MTVETRLRGFTPRSDEIIIRTANTSDEIIWSDPNLQRQIYLIGNGAWLHHLFALQQLRQLGDVGRCPACAFSIWVVCVPQVFLLLLLFKNQATNIILPLFIRRGL